MKYLKILFLFCIAQQYGQQHISKQIAFDNELIVVDLDDIDELRIEQSSTAMLSVEMEGQEDKLSMLDLTKTKGLILISSTELIDQTSNGTEKFCRIQPLFNSYTLKIPDGAQVKVTYLDGNMKVNNFFGDLDIKMNRGNIHLASYRGNCTISLYAGNVFAALKNTAFAIDTNLGNFKTDLSPEAYGEKSHHFTGVYGNAKNFLKVNTIRANIDLKGAENQ